VHPHSSPPLTRTDIASSKHEFKRSWPCTIKRGLPSLEVAIKAARHRKTVTREAAAQLTRIANCQFQLQRALQPGNTSGPLLMCGGYPFHGLHDAKLRIDEAITRVFSIRNENARALVYSEIYLLPELAAAATEKWEVQLELSRRIGDADGIKRTLTWLNRPDYRAISRIEKEFAFLDKTARCNSPSHFDKQILVLSKP